MNALKILEKIHGQMSLEEVLRLVNAAKKELDLKDTAQVAQDLGVKKQTIQKRADYHNIGHLIAARARVYSPSDIEQLRNLILKNRGHSPETRAMISKMRVMREQKQTLAGIGQKFGVSESYVSKLLKVAKGQMRNE